jgi:hypothetical protein
MTEPALPLRRASVILQTCVVAPWEEAPDRMGEQQWTLVEALRGPLRRGSGDRFVCVDHRRQGTERKRAKGYSVLRRRAPTSVPRFSGAP